MIRTDIGIWVSSANHGTGAFSTGSFTPPANSLLVVFVSMMGNNTTGDLGQPTISGGSLTYTFQGSARGDASWSIRLNLFTAPVGSSPSSMTITVDDNNNQNIYTYAVSVLAFTDYESGTPIAGLVTSGTTDISDGGESQTLGVSPVAGDISLLAVALDADSAPGNPTLASGWTKIHDGSVPGGGAGLYVARRENSTSRTVEITDVYTAGGFIYKGSMISVIIKNTTNVRVTPGYVVASGVVVAPSVGMSSQSVTPGYVVASGVVVAPSVVTGSVVVSPLAVTASGFVTNPSVLIGSVIVSPLAVTASGFVTNPSVIYGAVSVTPGYAVASGVAIAPSVVTGSVVVSPLAVWAGGFASGPSVIYGAVSVTPGYVVAPGDVVAPVVNITGAPTLGQADTPGAVLWMLANSYYENLNGLEDLEKPGGDNSESWGGKFFGS